MANVVNNPVDTRSFVQICAGLTKREWVELHGDLMQKLKKSAQCIYKWKRGESMPSSAMERVKISECINRKFQITTRHWTLFPES